MGFTDEQKQEIEQLTKKRDTLLQERTRLLAKWSDIQARKWIHNRRFPKSDGYKPPDEELYPLSEESKKQWEDTFFFTNPVLSEELSFSNLKPQNQNQLKEEQTISSKLWKARDFAYRNILTVCEGIIPTEKGPRLMLADPYGQLVTSVLEDLPMETAESWVGQVISAEIGFCMASDEHPIKNAYAIGHLKYEK